MTDKSKLFEGVQKIQEKFSNYIKLNEYIHMYAFINK